MRYTFYVCDKGSHIEVRVYSAKTFTDKAMAEATARTCAGFMGDMKYGVEEVK